MKDGREMESLEAKRSRKDNAVVTYGEQCNKNKAAPPDRSGRAVFLLTG